MALNSLICADVPLRNCSLHFIDEINEDINYKLKMITVCGKNDDEDTIN